MNESRRRRKAPDPVPGWTRTMGEVFLDKEPVVTKKRMKTSSAKAKGRKLQNWVAEKISKITGIEWGKDCMIQGREMGQSGVDVKLYGPAKEKFPFSVECKNQESWSVPAWVKQAKTNVMKGTDWLLVISKNRHEEIVVMNGDAFFDWMDRYLDLLYGPDHKIKDK